MPNIIRITVINEYEYSIGFTNTTNIQMNITANIRSSWFDIWITNTNTVIFICQQYANIEYYKYYEYLLLQMNTLTINLSLLYCIPDRKELKMSL